MALIGLNSNIHKLSTIFLASLYLFPSLLLSFTVRKKKTKDSKSHTDSTTCHFNGYCRHPGFTAGSVN